MADVITLGEPMVTLTPLQRGPLRHAASFQRGVGGAETNFAIGVARLGGSVRLLSRLGDDEFGRYIQYALRGEGLDVSGLTLVPDRPTGLNVKEVRENGDGKTFYYRTGSAASTMTPADLDPADFASASWLHVSGVFAAVNENTRATVFRAVELAKAAGAAISLDPNIRLKLWDAATARGVLLELAALADFVFPGAEEGEILVGSTDAPTIARELLALGPKMVVVKQGAAGATGYTAAGESFQVPGFPVRVVDTVGAGDGWAAGFTCGAVRGLGLAGSIRLANAVGAMVCSVTGDNEGLPFWDEVQAFMGNAPGAVQR